MTDSPLDGLLVVPEPIRGWRLFAVEGGRFVGLWHRGPEAEFAPDDRGWHRAACRRAVLVAQYWPGAPVVSEPVAPLHEAPQLECQCGFWAVARRDLLAEVVGRGWVPGGSSGNAQVVARVELAGRLVVHTKDGATVGWRAEQIRILAWWPIWPWLRRVGRHVGPLADWAERLLGAGPACRHCGAPGCPTHANPSCIACGRPSTELGCWREVWRLSNARGQA